MKSTRILPVAFLALLVAGAAMGPESSPAARAAAIVALAEANPAAVAGSFPTQWINGVDCANEEKVQVHEYVLQFKPEILAKILAASLAMGHDPECKIFEEFVIHPVYKCGIAWNG